MNISLRPGLPGLSRRQLLVGGAAMAFLAACGDDDSSGEPSGNGDEGETELSVVRFFGPFFAAGATARVPFGIADTAGLLPLDDTPETVEVVEVVDPDGTVVAEGVSAIRYSEGLPRPYFAVDVATTIPGFYDLVLDVDGTEVVSQFEVTAADDQALVDRVDPGDTFPVVPTPTTDDPRGVTPICTREPACDLHASSLDALLGTGPVALLIATPAFCQTVICGPVLDIMLDVVPDFGDISFVHAEVYSNPTDNDGQFTTEDAAPIMGAAGLPYEPVLYTIDSDGTVVGRLDYIFGEEEMRAALESLS